MRAGIDMNLGETLRSAREASRMSIEDLAAAISIRPGLLGEIENNNFIHCGGDIYARGHLRNIAPLIGLDVKAVLEQYNSEHSSESRSINDQLAENSITRVPHEKRNISWKIPAAFSLAILLVVGVVQIVLTNSDSGSTPSPVTSMSVEPTPSSSPIPTSEPTETTTPTTSGVTLSIAALAEARIDIVVDGQHLYKGAIMAGEVKDFSATTSISVYFSDAAAIEVTFNGEKLGTIGAAGTVIRKTFR